MLKDVFSFSNGRLSADSTLATFIDVAAEPIETVIADNATPQSHYSFKHGRCTQHTSRYLMSVLMPLMIRNTYCFTHKNHFFWDSYPAHILFQAHIEQHIVPSIDFAD